MTYEDIELSCITWEYLAADGNVYGPFSSKQMAQWSAGGYFSEPQVGANTILVRRVSGQERFEKESDDAATTRLNAQKRKLGRREGKGDAPAVISRGDEESFGDEASGVGKRVRFNEDGKENGHSLDASAELLADMKDDVEGREEIAVAVTSMKPEGSPSALAGPWHS